MAIGKPLVHGRQDHTVAQTQHSMYRGGGVLHIAWCAHGALVQRFRKKIPLGLIRPCRFFRLWRLRWRPACYISWTPLKEDGMAMSGQ